MSTFLGHKFDGGYCPVCSAEECKNRPKLNNRYDLLKDTFDNLKSSPDPELELERLPDPPEDCEPKSAAEKKNIYNQMSYKKYQKSLPIFLR
jgi:hypothetical protein